MLEELHVPIDLQGRLGIFMDSYGDVSEARWFPLARLPERIAFSNGRQALEALASSYQPGG